MLAVALMIAVVALDQLSKLVVRGLLPVGGSIPVVRGLFNICHVDNYGAAWGSLAGWRWFLLAVSVAMLAVLVRYRRAFLSAGAAGAVSFGLLLGGILGNFLDRFRLGFVVDFLDFFRGSFHFPAFNVADSAICAGVFLFWLASAFARPGRAAAK